MTATLVDLNLLPALDALLQERSVTRAAERVHITVPAMSRTLGRLRTALGDELLVRAGRQLVLTPVATAMKERVHSAAVDALSVLQPPLAMPLSMTSRSLVIRCNDAVGALLAAPIEQARLRDAPRIQIRFVHEGEEDAASLREGRVDLDIGVVDFSEPEMMTLKLVSDRFVGVVRNRHPILKRLTQQTFASARHLSISRRGRATGPIDAALRERGLEREVAAVVPDFLVAFHAVANTALVAAAPERLVTAFSDSLPITSFPIPLPLPAITIGMAWHPRVTAEPVHAWLRAQVQARFSGQGLTSTASG